jgi:multiple sugar transport system substrate-binding protein
MRSGTMRPLALTGVAVLAAGVVLAGCGKADTGGGGTTGGNGGGELTLWTHNAGNKEELAVVNQIVADYNAQ